MKRLAVLGASGHGKVVADAAILTGWDEVVFFDDAYPDVLRNGSWKVHGNSAAMLSQMHEFDGVIVAIGNNRIRLEKLNELLACDAPVVTIQHPHASVSAHARIGRGTAILAGAVVNADTEVGLGGILNTLCSVDHDCSLGMAVHISPGAHLAGGVWVGDRTWLGIGCSVKQLVSLGADVVVGAGAAVVADVPDALTVVGVPARPLC